MKSKILHSFVAAAILLLSLASCGGSKAPSPLIAQSERLALDFGTLAEESPMFLQSIDVDYADAVLSVALAFADSTVKVPEYSEALVQFALAQYLKDHTGKNLDEIINTISAEEGKLSIKLTDVYGNTRDFDVSGTRLKQLVKSRPMELGLPEVRTNISDILASRCAAYKDQYNADDCEFEIQGGFAQYTLTFPRSSAWGGLTQPTLTGRYLKGLQARYDDFGACRPMIEQLLRSVSIDGYRFIYTDKTGSKTLSAGIPWRLIDKPVEK